MNILTFILLIILYITLMVLATYFLVIDELFLNNTIQNTFSNILNRIKGGKDE